MTSKLKTCGLSIASYANTQTGKLFEYRDHGGISISETAPNNTDGIGRYIIPESYQLVRDGHDSIRRISRYKMIWLGVLPENTKLDLIVSEIEELAKTLISHVREIDIKNAVISVSSLPGAEAGYSEEELAAGRYIGGLIIELWSQV